MRRAHDLAPDLSDLDALVLEEIASLGDRRSAHAPSVRRPRDRGVNGDPGCSEIRTGRSSPQAGQPVAPIHPRGWAASPTAGASGEEAEGLFDQPFELADEPETAAADGPTAADLLTPEEQAFISRAVGFLCDRPNADLILDRVWSQAIQSRPDGFYDPDSPNPLDDATPASPQGEDPGEGRAARQTNPARPADPVPGTPSVLRVRPVRDPMPPADPKPLNPSPRE